MGKIILAVLKDLTSLDSLAPGEIVQCFEGRLKVLDPNYQNKYGEFIQCEILSEQQHSAAAEDRKGVPVHFKNPYEVVGTLHMPGLRYFPRVPGYFLKNRRTGKVKGYSFSETFDLLFQEGASNAEAILIGGKRQSIQFIEELPSFRSYYWKIPVYKENGELYAELTSAAKEAMDRLITRRKERMLCEVCRENVVKGAASSTIAPVTVAVCHSCGSKGAQPYEIVVTRVAFDKQENSQYRPSPHLRFVMDATLAIVGKSREQFEADVAHRLLELESGKQDN